MNILFRNQFTFMLLVGTAFSSCSKNSNDENYNLTYVPDDKFEEYLIKEGWDDKMDNYVATENIEGITKIWYQFSGLTDLTGIEDFSELESLTVYAGGPISSVKLRENKKLKYLAISSSNSELNEIDLSQNVNLISLNLYGNKLQKIDLKNLHLLEGLDIRNNNLMSLDVSANTLLQRLQTSGNSLQCIKVNEDHLKNIPENWNKEETTIYSTQCI